MVVLGILPRWIALPTFGLPPSELELFSLRTPVEHRHQDERGRHENDGHYRSRAHAAHLLSSGSFGGQAAHMTSERRLIR